MEQTLTLLEDGTMLVCPCIALRLYLDLTNNEAILDFYNQSMTALTSELKFVLTESARRPARVTAKALTTVPTWLKKPQPHKGYFISFGEVMEGCGAARLQLSFLSKPEAEFTAEKLERRRGYWRTQPAPGNGMGLSEMLVTFPLEHPLANPTKLVPWIKQLQLVSQGPLVSGSCGLALNDYSSTGNGDQGFRIEQRMASLVLRHPGLIWQAGGGPGNWPFVFLAQADDLIPLIIRVNWLTFVGEAAVKFLGGVEALKSQFSSNPAIVVHEFPWGIIVQAGPQPQLGDAGQRDFIPIYREVAKVLRPIRMNKVDGIGRGFSDEAAEEWLNAFDRDY